MEVKVTKITNYRQQKIRNYYHNHNPYNGKIARKFSRRLEILKTQHVPTPDIPIPTKSIRSEEGVVGSDDSSDEISRSSDSYKTYTELGSTNGKRSRDAKLGKGHLFTTSPTNVVFLRKFQKIKIVEVINSRNMLQRPWTA